MKTKLLILILLCTQIFYAQITIEEDNLTVEYIKTKKASQFLMAETNVRTKSKNVVQYNIKARIEMSDNKRELFDPNKFSLIDHQNELRLRPLDVAYTNFTDKWHFVKLIKNKPQYKSLEDKYKPDVRDTFLDYEFDGVTNLSMPISFEAYNEYKISFKNPERVAHETYFEPKSLRKRNINLYFPMQESVDSATLYSGNIKIQDIQFK